MTSAGAHRDLLGPYQSIPLTRRTHYSGVLAQRCRAISRLCRATMSWLSPRSANILPAAVAHFDAAAA